MNSAFCSIEVMTIGILVLVEVRHQYS